MILSMETILEMTVLLLQMRLLSLKSYLDQPASSPLLSDHGDSNLEKGKQNNGIPIDDGSESSQSSLISQVICLAF